MLAPAISYRNLGPPMPIPHRTRFLLTQLSVHPIPSHIDAHDVHLQPSMKNARPMPASYLCRALNPPDSEYATFIFL